MAYDTTKKSMRVATLALVIAAALSGCGSDASSHADAASGTGGSTSSAGGNGGDGVGGEGSGGDGVGGGSGGSGGDGGGAVILAGSRLSLGQGFSCRARTDDVICWGRNDRGQLGDGTGTLSSTAVAVTGIGVATDLTAGTGNAAVVLEDGTVRAWGAGLFGALGNGSLNSSDVPVTTMIDDVAAIALGSLHGCALRNDKTVHCWGRNNLGELGTATGTADNYSTVPLKADIDDAIAIAAAGEHTCALLGNGTIRCWGANNIGQLGNGTTSTGSTVTPVEVMGIDSAIAISAADERSCALLEDSTVTCWGRRANAHNGSDDSSVPIAVPNFTNVTQLTVGGGHACAIRDDKSLWCWGSNGFGALGNGTNDSALLPIEVPGFADVETVAAGQDHTCATLVDESIWCWGTGGEGQLGNGVLGHSNIPVAVSLP